MWRWTALFACFGLLGMLAWGCQGHGRSAAATSSGPSGREGRDGSATTSQAAEGKRPKVVIKDFRVTGLSSDEGAGIAGKFCVDVSKSKKIELICAEDLTSFFQHQEDRIAFGACNQEDCLAKLGRKLDADFIVQGAINQVGDVYTFQINLVEAKSGKVKTRFSREVSSGKVEDLLEAATALADDLAQEF